MKTLLTCHRLSPYRCCVSLFWVARIQITQAPRNGEIGNACWSWNSPAKKNQPARSRVRRCGTGGRDNQKKLR